MTWIVEVQRIDDSGDGDQSWCPLHHLAGQGRLPCAQR